MGTYYNRTQGNLPVTLLDGTSHSVPAKGRFEVEAENESSPDLLSLLAKGFFVKIPSRRSTVSATAVPSASAPAPVSVPELVEVVSAPSSPVTPIVPEPPLPAVVPALNPAVAVEFSLRAASDTSGSVESAAVSPQLDAVSTEPPPAEPELVVDHQNRRSRRKQ